MVRGCLLLAISLSLLSGCSKKKGDPVTIPVVSPPSVPLTPGGKVGPKKKGRVVAWPHRVRPDQGRRPVDASAPSAKNKKKRVATDADIAAQKAAMERYVTEKAINQTLNTALPTLRACFQRHRATVGELQIKIRVHRSGHVLEARASGQGSAVNACVEHSLNRLRVSGVKTDTLTVERRFTFR